MTNKTITLARETLENSLKDGSSDPVVYASYRKAVADIRAALAEPTIGIDHETMRARYTDPEAVGLSSGTGSTLRVVAADPVPPAGGEVEVLARVCKGHVLGWGLTGYLSVEIGTELVDRAHVTWLQAEVERLKAACSKEFESVEALSHELTKARELLVLVKETWKVQDPDDGDLACWESIDEFLAGQSAPADKGWGEPVAWLSQNTLHPEVLELSQPNFVSKSSHWAPAFPVYRKPAPVAVVLPERAPNDEYGEDWDCGFNACLDEVARLNSEPKP